jgi:hypothetical protein
MRSGLALLLFAPLFGGCVMDLPQGDVLDRPRVLAARLEPEADPTRAWAVPGETVRYLTLAESPATDTLWTSSFILCEAQGTNTGFPACVGEPFAFAPPAAPTPDVPDFTFNVPSPPSGDRLLLVGVVCANGTATIDLETMRPACEGGPDTVTEAITSAYPLALDVASANRHPTLDGSRFTVDGGDWTEPPAELPLTDCETRRGGMENADSALPRVALQIDVTEEEEDEADSVIGFTFADAARETFQQVVIGQEEPRTDREELTINHVATAGSYRRPTSTVTEPQEVDGRRVEGRSTVSWDHPLAEEVPEGGLTVRHFFVVRDLRGGVSYVERALCLVR